MKAKILLVDDEKILREVLEDFLKDKDYEVEIAETGSQALELLKKNSFDLVILDISLPDGNGLELIPKIKEFQPEIGIILISAYAGVKSVVSAIKQGAFDYLIKPFDGDELLLTIEKFLQFRSLRSEVTTLRKTLSSQEALTKFVGESKLVQELLAHVETVAETDLSVLILGESGTGKELIAQIIHEISPRRDYPFIKINCTAIPDTLFEAELFGYVKGAFTGAINNKIGKIELAQGGTLLFDEIGDLSLHLQPKLLRVLEEKTYYPLGSTKEKKVNVRFLFTTSKDLKKLVELGQFRDDLYYRLSAFILKIPPLRKRKEDLPVLIQHFLHQLAQKYGKGKPEVSEQAFLALLNYSYPGNVRELKHLLERAYLLAKNGRIELHHLPEEVQSGFSELIVSSSIPSGKIQIKKTLEILEKELILRTLAECEGKISLAAQKLGISRKTLWKKLKKYSPLLNS